VRRTLDDDRFATEFGRELSRHYHRVTNESRISDEDFARSLGVTRPALMKYLHGNAMPGLGVVVQAFLQYGVNIPYRGTPLFGSRKRPKGEPAVSQLVLPFSVQSAGVDTIETNLDRKGPNGFELRITLNKAG
jgi:transcriptional regulator with XRE-family HTH domain